MATVLSELRPDGVRGSGVSGAGRVGLSRMDLFAGLPERDLALLDSRLPLVRWPRGASMPEPLSRTDHLFVVREGRLALFESTAPGHEIMISLLDPGAIYSTLGAAPAASISALEDSAVSPLSGRAIEGLIARYPRLGRNLAELLSDRIATLRETVALVSEMRVEDRLRARLHQLADGFGLATRAGIELRLELTHAQWASLVGASREAVTTAFSKLRGSGAIEMDGRSITIPWDVVKAREEAVSLAAADAG
ncbi:MAG TPA: Crp/Fnr family transcriptional regulator [Miltoncostaeaceae bacterium]|jgi:CRP/FNR family transcriptional regulator|nr:Crp/Fnr family transcriptional regulator [Miltoncostaeaceae bacterium]